MSTSTIGIMISIIAYMAFVIGIGIWSFKRNSHNTDEFFLGGRKLGPFVTAMSAEASDMSSYLLMGVPGVAYMTGLADAFWTAFGLAVGTYLNWLFVARRLRTYTVVCGNSTTLPVFFSNRYRDDKKILSVISAIIIVIFFVPYVGSGFSACGKLFGRLFSTTSELTTKQYHTAMIVFALVIIFYTTLGGFMAASTSDFWQSIIMTFALVVIVIYGVNSVGGMGAVMDNARNIAGYFDLNAMHDAATGNSVDYGFITKISTLAWGLGYFGMPHILLRFMAIENPSKLKLSRRVATVWVFISLGVAVFIGIMGCAMSNKGVIEQLADGEQVIIVISQLIASHGVLAALLAGLILAGILAATMSTADSQLLAASSSVSQNILKEVFMKDIDAKTEMIIARATVGIVSIIGVVIAWNPNSSVFNIVSFAWAGFGAAFGPTVLLALFWKRSNLYGALAGMVSGGAMIFIWKFLVRPLGGALNIYELLPAFIVAFVFNIAVSLLTKAPSEEITKEFEAVQESLKNA